MVRTRDVDQASVGMTFTGPAVVGGPDVTLTGTAESIHAQLLQLNPQYDPWDFPEYQEKMAAQNMTRETWEAQAAGLSKRSNQLTKRGWVCFCLFSFFLFSFFLFSFFFFMCYSRPESPPCIKMADG